MCEIKICEYTSDDRLACIKLLEKTFPGLSGEENFIWRFESLKINTPIIVCAKNNDDIVGFDSYIPWRFVFNNKEYIGYQGGESATAKNYRGQGIQNRLKSFARELALEKNIDFIFGSGTLPVLKAAFKAGYCQVAFLPLYQKIVSPFYKKKSEEKVVETKQPLNIMLREEKKITPIVDANYLEWRYYKNPKSYDIIQFEKDNNQALFCVRKRKLWNKILRISTNDLFVLDCQFSSFNEKFIKWSFKLLESIYSRKVITMSVFFNENTDRGRAIRKQFSYKRSSHSYGLIFRPIKKDLDLNVFLNHNNWDILPHIVDWY